VEKWLSDAGVVSVDDLSEAHPSSAVHMVAALHKMMATHLRDAQSVLEARHRVRAHNTFLDQLNLLIDKYTILYV
jgi:hypothetical protein